MNAQKMRCVRLGLRMLLCGVSVLCVAQPSAHIQAIRLNNRGVALMSQQFTQRAADSFAQALQEDPTLTQAAINEGIALLVLQKVDEAKRLFQQVIATEPKNPQAWYNLGLAQHTDNQLSAALASFQQAVRLDPQDADSLYYEGACYQEMRQFDRAIPIYRQTLAINPLHVSAEFGLARSLQRTGDTAEARKCFARFQHLTSTKIASPLALAYGEQGHYSTVKAVAEPKAIQHRMIPVRFGMQPMLTASTAGLSGATGGACMMDATGSGRMDLVLMLSGKQSIAVLHNSGGATFQRLDSNAIGLHASGHAVACAVGDYDGDGRNDLAVAMEDRLLLFRNLGQGHFEDVTAAAGLLPRNRPTGLTFVDYDHDGHLDLFLTGDPMQVGGEANVLWRNNANGTFTERTAETGLGGAGKTEAAILTDFNNDRAVDLAVTGDAAAPTLYVNPREGKFPTQPIYASTSLPSALGIAVLDFNRDGWMDIAMTHTGAPGITLWQNDASTSGTGRRFARVPLPLADATRGWGLTPIDVDNDGWLDVAAVVQTRVGTQVRVFRNMGNGSFQDVSHKLGLDRIRWKAARGLIAADVDGDGATDLIVTQKDAAPVLLRNLGANRNHFVRLDLSGLADNKTGLGAKVEVFADGLWQKWELAGASGYQTQAPPQILVGLGDAKSIDLLRILWPTGVLQDEIDLPRKPVVAIKEADRRGSSCPVLFAWNGHRYAFITDVIGAGVVGHWFTPARRNTPNPEEWVKIDGASVKTFNGKVSVRFMEPMEEVNYIDQLRMVAVDHPADVMVNPDERFLDDPPFATGRVIASVGAHVPAGAWNDEGKSVLERLSRQDHVFVSDFVPLPYDGFAKMHALTLDLGQREPDRPLRLLMTGYVNYFSATSLYAAWQAGIREIPPYVEAELPDGRWQRIPGFAGFPAGLERTIVVDLTGKLPAGTRRIRLKTNLQIYWDQVLVDESRNAPARATELPLATATLHFRGYPKEMDGSSEGDISYDYNLVSLTGPFQRERGSYTHFGDVTPLLKRVDNRFAIFGSGEGIAAEFDATSLPALPPNWKRDYFFYANGFVKDMDWWDASPFTVGQLPFHEMSQYPYPKQEQNPDDDSSLDYRLEWNDRFHSGEPEGLHSFHYEPSPSTPRDDLQHDSVPDVQR